MKYLLSIILTLSITFNLCACQRLIESEKEPIQKEPTESVTPEPDVPEEPIEPAHSELYLSDVTQEDMINYFNEVVLNIEYSNGLGDATLVQKWLAPIRYRIEGNPTAEDLAVLESLFEQLNNVQGFPGIYAVTDNEVENLTISFLEMDAFNDAFSEVIQGEIADGAVQFWYYNENNEIYSGRIGYRTDISQDIRNSVLLEEIINLLGITDTELRSDSIVYQYSSDATQLSPVDWVILKLLYNSEIQSGANAEACRPVLEELYY